MTTTIHDYDLLILGAGSGNYLPDPATSTLRTAIVEVDRFGGTCLNRGCIPSKMFVYAADVAETVRHAGRFGVDADLRGVDWPAIRARVFSRIDPLHERAVEYRRRSGVDVHLGAARFVAPRTVEVDGRVLRAERLLVAVGSRPSVPDLPGLSDVPFHTSDTIMRVDRLPGSMVVLGGGFIGAEMSHVFGGLGTRVALVHRGPTLLAAHDADVRTRFTEAYAERFALHLSSTVERVRTAPGGVAVDVVGPAGRQTLEAEVLLVATGRIPNTDLVDAAAGGLALDDHGHIVTDATYATSVPGVWAIGDVANHFQLKHMANAEVRLVRHNMLHPDEARTSPFTSAPSAVFADPQVASVGATEEQLVASGQPYVSAVRPYSDTAYGWAMEDTRSFVKVLADPGTRLLLAAHVLGPQAATLVQPLIQAMALGTTVDVVARGVLYIHPALTEVVEQALLEL